jgi:hypothetical protein
MFYPVLRSRREHSALTPNGRIYAEDEISDQPLPPAAPAGSGLAAR